MLNMMNSYIDNVYIESIAEEDDDSDITEGADTDDNILYETDVYKSEVMQNKWKLDVKNIFNESDIGPTRS